MQLSCVESYSPCIIHHIYKVIGRAGGTLAEVQAEYANNAQLYIFYTQNTNNIISQCSEYLVNISNWLKMNLGKMEGMLLRREQVL